MAVVMHELLVCVEDMYAYNSQVLDVQWMPWQDTSRDLLLTVHASSHAVCLWNADAGERVWRKTYAEALVSVTIDPFDAFRCAR
jgi:hypothetical protein